MGFQSSSDDGWWEENATKTVAQFKEWLCILFLLHWGAGASAIGQIQGSFATPNLAKKLFPFFNSFTWNIKQ